MFQYLNEYIVDDTNDSDTIGYLRDVVSAYKSAIVSFDFDLISPGTDLTQNGCNAINRLIFESIDYGNEVDTDFDTKLQTMK